MWPEDPDRVLDKPGEAVLEGAALIVRYDRDADILLVRLRDEVPADAVEEEGGIIISYNEKGLPVTVEFVNASKHGLVKPEDPSIVVAGLRAQSWSLRVPPLASSIVPSSSCVRVIGA